MKYTLLIIAFAALLFSCKNSKEAVNDPVVAEKKATKEKVKANIPIKESMFLTMERTPCYGQCPSYKIMIFNTGNVTYEGFSHTDKIGKYSKKLTQKQLKEIHKMMDDIDIINMKDSYDSEVTDFPSTILFLIHDYKKKKILDRVEAPRELKQFEKLIDFLVLDDKLKSLGGNK